MSTTTTPEIHDFIINATDTIGGSPLTSPAPLFSVLMITIFRIVLMSCIYTTDLVKSITGPFHGLFNVVAYACMAYIAAKWVMNLYVGLWSQPEAIKVNMRDKSTGTDVTLKQSGQLVPMSTEKEGIMALCYIDGVFNTDKANELIKEVREAILKHNVLSTLPAIRKNLEGIREDTPMRELNVAMVKVHGRWGELARQPK